MTGRVVVAGAAGFIGSAVVRGLGGAAVTALHRSDVDLNDTDAVRRALRAGDVVVNAAGYADVTDISPEGERRFRASNVDAVRSLADACADVGVAHLVHVSSVAAMGRWRGRGIDESHEHEPETPYARSKRDAERVLAAYGDRLPITVLRPTSVFGEGRPLAASLCRAASRSVVLLPGFGRALIPFTYVGNVVEAVRLATGNDRCFGRTFTVGDERSYSLREILEAFAGALGTSPRFLGVPGSAAMVAARAATLAARRRTSTASGIRRMESLTTSVEYSIAAFQSATG